MTKKTEKALAGLAELFDTKIPAEDISNIYIGEWDYEYRNPEACEPADNIATSFNVTAVDYKGRTWVHHYTLSTENHHRDECRERLAKLIGRIHAHLVLGGSIDLEHWGKGHPAYGSEAWQEFEREEIQPAAEMVSRGTHPEDLPDSVRGYF